MTLSEAIEIAEKDYGNKDYDCTDEVWSRIEQLLPEYKVFILWEDSTFMDFYDEVKNKSITLYETDYISLCNNTGTVILYK